MSDEKKRDRALQHRVRERQAKTGESYQAAWRHVAGSEAGGGVESEASSPPRGTRRVPLPFSAGTDPKTGERIKILPGYCGAITARPQLEFWPDRLLIKNAEYWDVHQLFVGHSDATEYAKAQGSLLETKPGSSSVFSLEAWHPLATREVSCGEGIVLVVEYTGKKARGECFEATMFGWDGQPPTKAAKSSNDAERVTERAESARVAVNETVKLPLTVRASALFVDRVTIMDAKNWVVNDVLALGKSIFVQTGELPGDMFLDSAHVILEPLAAGDRVEIVATYIGNSSSACLAVELSGTMKPPSEPWAPSFFLPMSTGVTTILPAQTAQITGRPKRNFLPDRLVIADPDDWEVNDIRVGTHSQTAQSGVMPGQVFSGRLVEGHVTFDPVRKGQDFTLITTRGEDCKKSAVFVGGVQGRLA